MKTEPKTHDIKAKMNICLVVFARLIHLHDLDQQS